MIGAVFIYNKEGEVLVNRQFRNEIPNTAVDAFRENVIKTSSPLPSPINTFEDVTYYHVKEGNVWLVVASKQNNNETIIFEYMRKLKEILESFFTKVDGNTMKNNFLLIYEILDETVDFGYPQIMSASMLKTIVSRKNSDPNQDLSGITSQMTGKIAWRREGIHYKEHAFYMDVIEHISVLMLPKGKIRNAHVTGKVILNTCLSGLPVCVMGLNGKPAFNLKARAGPIKMEDCQFHQCVQLNKYEEDGKITFVPPDGKFVLMNYRITKNIRFPFKIIPLMRLVGREKVEIKLTLRSTYKSYIAVNDIELKIPIPLESVKVKVSNRKGRAKYNSKDSAVVWKIPRMHGKVDIQLSLDVFLKDVQSPLRRIRPPISIHFGLPFAPSRFHVQFCNVSESKYKYTDDDFVKWARYVGHSGTYEIQI